MNFSIFIISLALSIRKAVADSEEFTLKLSASGTSLNGYSIYVGDDSKVYMDTSGNTCTGIIKDDSTLVIDNQTMGIGKNFLSLESQSSSFKIAEPFTIVDGILKLYGSNFHAVPSGEENQYVLGSINAMGSSSRYEIEIIAEGADGNPVPDFDGSTASSSSVVTSASETMESSITTNIPKETLTTKAETSSSNASSPSNETSPSETSISETSSVTELSSFETRSSSTKENSFSTTENSLSTTEVSTSSKIASSATQDDTTISHYENLAVKNGVSIGSVLLGALALL